MKIPRESSNRDEYGKEIVKLDPVFTKNQIANMKSKWWTYLLLLILFGTAEAYLYVLTASTFMPSSPQYVQVLVGVLFAIGFMYALGYSFEHKAKVLRSL